jgi:predicted kinase
MQLLLISGPAGVGKSTLSWEMSAQLAAAQVAHAVIETDELDRVFPRPNTDELDRIRPGTTDVSNINLAAIWSTYQALGHTRLIMSGVMMHLNFDKRWILSAIPDARITVVRMLAAEPTLLARLAQREMGSGADEQARRSLRQARRMASEDADGVIVLPTDDKRPAELAEFILQKIGWLNIGGQQKLSLRTEPTIVCFRGR